MKFSIIALLGAAAAVVALPTADYTPVRLKAGSVCMAG
jgi:hypothetical protein